MRIGSRIGWVWVVLGGAATLGQPPALQVVVSPSGTGNPACHAPGADVSAVVELGPSETGIIGGQFLLQYDPTLLTFMALDEGLICDATSPFDSVTTLEVDNPPGTVFAVIEAGAGSGGATLGATLACLQFKKTSACGDSALCLAGVAPQETVLTDVNAVTINPQLTNGGCSSTIRTLGQTTLSCPSQQFSTADCDGGDTSFSWAPVSGLDTCEGALIPHCMGVHDGGQPVSAAAIAGGELPVGMSTFTCTVESSCGEAQACQWEVEVVDAVAVDLDVELSPVVTNQPIDRCIELVLFADCEQGPTTVHMPVTFNEPGMPSGRAFASFTVDRADYTCMSARDPVHTLRSVATMECGADGRYTASFVDDPAIGGTWLTGGNLDRNGVIDILDFGVLVSQYLTAKDPNTSCVQISNSLFRHADVNGDGLVDVVELSFIMINFLQSNQLTCCDGGATPIGRSSIPVVELVAAFGYHFARADITQDGTVDISDMLALLAGNLPPTIGSKLPTPPQWDSDDEADD